MLSKDTQRLLTLPPNPLFTEPWTQKVVLHAALATEAPTSKLLEEKPHGRNEPLINAAMWRQILGQVSYQLVVLFLIIYGAPQYISTYSLPTACPTYSAVDANGIDISALNATGGSLAYNPLAPSPSTTYSEQKARCWRGPCVNLCCNTNAAGFCTDNLVSDGGHYLPSANAMPFLIPVVLPVQKK